MSRPAWLGDPPTGCQAELYVLLALLSISRAYAELGHVPPPSMLEALRERVLRLEALLPLELGL